MIPTFVIFAIIGALVVGLVIGGYLGYAISTVAHHERMIGP